MQGRDIAEKESPVGVAASWLSLGGSFVLSFATWVALAELAGFSDTLTLPMIGVTLYLSFAMPLCVDGFVVMALVTWMAPVSQPVADFAKRCTYGAAGIGVVTQSAYHGAITWQTSRDVLKVVLAAGVGLLPPLLAAGAVHLRALVRRAALDRAAEAARVSLDRSESDRVTAPTTETVAPVAPVVVAPVAPATVALPAVAAVAEPVVPVTVDPVVPAVAPVAATATRKPAATTWDKDKAIELLSQGRRPVDIAEIVGTSKKTIERLRASLQTAEAAA